MEMGAPHMRRLTRKSARGRLCSQSQYLRQGFTLIELVVVIAVLAILAAIAIPQYIKMERRPPPTGTTSPILAAADKELAKLGWQGMAYSVPQRMEIGSTADVNLALGGNKSVAELVLLLENAGKAEGLRVQVTDRMEARLTGSGFEIIASTPETQLVSTRQVTRWQWQVKAKEIGVQKLYLSLNALLNVNRKDTAMSVSTFQREIIVEVTSIAGFWALVERYWAYLAVALTAVLMPLVVYLWKKLWGKSDGSD